MKKLYRVEMARIETAVAYVAAESEYEAETIAKDSDDSCDWESDWNIELDGTCLADNVRRMQLDGWESATPLNDETDTPCVDWLKPQTAHFVDVALLPDPKQIVLGAGPPPILSAAAASRWHRYNELLSQVHRGEDLTDEEGFALLQLHDDENHRRAIDMIQKYRDSSKE